MADNLPAPESRVESYLAKAAGEDVTIPEKPLSRTEQYLAAIAEGGGGGGGGSINVINNLESTSTTDALSANMGRELNNLMNDFTSFKLFTEYSGEPNMPMNSETPDGYNAFLDPNTIFYSTVDEPIKLYYSETDYIDNFIGYVLSNTSKVDELDGSIYYSFVIVKNVENGNAEIYVGETKSDGESGELTNLSFTQVGAGGGGSIKDLTAADLDYPVSDPSGIALWNLDAGTYRNATNGDMYLSYSSSLWTQRKLLRAGDVFTVLSKRDYNGNIYSVAQVGMDSYNDIEFIYGNGAGTGAVSDLVSFKKVANNLTTTSTGQYALDAYQGYILNGKITPTTDASAPTTSTQGELGKIFIDTTNDDAYMCVKASGGTYTWKKITP